MVPAKWQKVPENTKFIHVYFVFVVTRHCDEQYCQIQDNVQF